MIVSISGIERSGSTVTYNIVRLILEAMGYKVVPQGNEYRGRQPNEGEAILYKIHTYSPRIAAEADHIFLTDRNIEDVKASMERFYGKKPSKEKVANARAWLMGWNRCEESHMIAYERFENDKLVLIRWACDILGADIDAFEILRQFNSIGLPDEGQDSESLFFHNHITSR